jgi:hypothetical protein
MIGTPNSAVSLRRRPYSTEAMWARVGEAADLALSDILAEMTSQSKCKGPGPSARHLSSSARKRLEFPYAEVTLNIFNDASSSDYSLQLVER